VSLKYCLLGVTLIELHIDGYNCFCSEFSVHSRGVCRCQSLTNSHHVLVWAIYHLPNSSYTNDSELWKLINVAAEMDSDFSHLLITSDFTLQSFDWILRSAPGSDLFQQVTSSTRLYN